MVEPPVSRMSAALVRKLVSGEARALVTYARAVSSLSANALRYACSATVSDLGGACAVSYTVPSTIALAMSRAVLSRLGSAANACLYAHTDESRWAYKQAFAADPNRLKTALLDRKSPRLNSSHSQ